MKNLLLLSLVLFFSVSFSQTKKIDVQKSSIHWVGKKIMGQHDGTINFKEGSLVFDGKKLTGGNFVVDMTTIDATDVEGGAKKKLNNHLKSDDFFGVEKFPTSSLVFKEVKAKENGVYSVKADLTIKGITNPVSFDITVKENTAETNLVVDRTKYDVKYGSKSFFEGIGDRAIHDEFELEVKLSF